MERIGQQERLFFGHSRLELEEVLNIPLESLPSCDQLTVPPQLFSYCQRVLGATAGDFRERYAVFKADGKGGLTVAEEGLGTKTSLPSTGASCSCDSLPKFLYRRYFAYPCLVDLHSHSQLDPKELTKSIAWNRKPIISHATVEHINALNKYFSPGDLSYMLERRRYLRSSFLVSSGGLVWVINLQRSLPFCWDWDSKDSVEAYGSLADGLIDGRETDKAVFNRTMHKALASFCQKQNFIGFINNDPTNSCLQRLDPSG